MEAGLNLFGISSEKVLELFEHVSRTSGCRCWRSLVIHSGCVTQSVPFRRRETEARSHYSLCASMQEEAPWEVQNCETQSGQYCYGSNKWCYWTFFPIAKLPKMTLRPTKCAFGWGDFWVAVGRQSSFFPIPHFRPLSPFHSSTEWPRCKLCPRNIIP